LDQAVHYQQMALKASPEHPTYRQFLRNHYASLTDPLGRLGEHAEAANAAENVARLTAQAWEDHFVAAGVLAHCVLLVQKDPKLTGNQRQKLKHHYADRCRKLLREVTHRSKSHLQAQHSVARFLALCPHAKVRDPAWSIALARVVAEQAQTEGA